MTLDQELKFLRCLAMAHKVESKNFSAHQQRDWLEKQRLLRRIDKLRRAVAFHLDPPDADRVLEADLKIARYWEKP